MADEAEAILNAEGNQPRDDGPGRKAKVHEAECEVAPLFRRILTGVPQSAEAMQVERFTPSPDGKTMTFELTSIDPVYLIGSPVRTGTYTSMPGRELEPCECVIWEEAQ